MAKLYFYYGPMGSMKSAKAIITAFNYEENGHKALCITSSLDNRFSEGRIASRIAGLGRPAIPIDKCANLIEIFEQEKKQNKVDVIICDEVQFFTRKQIEQLTHIVDEFDIDVLCYGLRTDFRLELFEGSAALLAMADIIKEEIAMCVCGRKATVNARIINGKVIDKGEQILVGGNEQYKPFCRRCWKKELRGC